MSLLSSVILVVGWVVVISSGPCFVAGVFRGEQWSRERGAKGTVECTFCLLVDVGQLFFVAVSPIFMVVFVIAFDGRG